MTGYNPRVTRVAHIIMEAVRAKLVQEKVNHSEYQAFLKWCNDLVGAGELRMFIDNFYEHTIEEITFSGRPGSEGTVQGPYYVPGAPLLDERPFVLPMREDEAGVPFVLNGKVIDLAGRPISGALIDLWHAGNDGTYSGFVGDAPSYNLRAKFRTDKDGTFQVRTIRPSPYQIPTHGPVGEFLTMIDRHAWRPGHFHLKVSAEGSNTLITQIYFRGGPWLDGDGDVSGAVKESLIIDVIDDKDETVASKYGLTIPFQSASYTFQLGPEVA